MDPYEVLNLKRDCNKKEIRNAYKKMALKYHPDKNTKDTTAKFKEISKAYQTLYDDELRKKYDSNIKINFEFKDASDLFSTIFNNMEPNLANFLKNTYNSFNDALNKSENKNLYTVIENMDKKNIIKDGTDLISGYIFKNLFNTDLDIKKTDDCSVKINYNDLKTYNKITVSIETYYKYEKIKVLILENNDEMVYYLNTEYKNQTLKINEKLYNFELVDEKHEILRTNSYDAVLHVEIGLEDYLNNFLFIYQLFYIKITKSINLHQNKSMIVKFKNYGFPIWSDKNRGDLYVNFYINKNRNRLHGLPISDYFTKSAKIENLIDDINLYD